MNLYKILVNIGLIIIVLICIIEFEAYTDINFHKVINSKLYEGSSISFDESFPPEYHQQSNDGKKNAKHKKIVISGLARNIEKIVSSSLSKLEFIGDHFNDYRIICFENDSDDNTRNIIKQNIKRNDRIILLDCLKYNTYDCLLKKRQGYDIGWGSSDRFINMANYREELLEYIRDNLSDYDYVLIVDLDLNGNFCIDGMMMGFADGVYDWGALYSNGQTSYYGLYGTTTFTYDLLAYIDACDEYPHNVNYFTTSVMAKNLYKLNSKTNHMNGFVPVKSSFNGMALYQMKPFINSSYKGLNICEHINLAKGIDEQKYNQYINCAWFGYSNIQGPKGFLNLIF